MILTMKNKYKLPTWTRRYVQYSSDIITAIWRIRYELKLNNYK